MSPLVEPGGLLGLRAVAREMFERMDDPRQRDARRVGAMLWAEAMLDPEILRSQIEQGLVNGLERLKHHVKTDELIGVDFRVPVGA